MSKYIYQTVQENEYLDVYRITEGVLLKVYKVRAIEGVYFIDINKRKMEKISKDIYKLKEKNSVYGTILEAGTIVLENVPVKITELKNYRYEIKTTGNSLGGSAINFSRYLDTINHLINKTQNPSQYEWENGNPEYMQGGQK